jgi:diadenosine tetraphosphatase ApaH/serine/threonine PP2A family protein phosphatase
VRYAILSDVHGNLESLRAVLADAREQVDAVLCLGDIVGYGADPQACIELIAERSMAVVGGNHEHAVAGLMSLQWFNPYARAAAEWTRQRLVHASPARPEEWEYLVTAEDGYTAFPAFVTRLCFVGHSHLPGMWVQGSWGRAHDPTVAEITVEPGCRYIVNVGSVGQPRDHDARAAWALWDVDARRVSLRRVAYDVGAAQAKIRAAGLPRYLADRLAAGR